MRCCPPRLQALTSCGCTPIIQSLPSRRCRVGITNSFAYNWLIACGGSNPPANTPPTVANPVSPQSATVGIGYTLSLTNVFTDAETPNNLVLSVTGLPAGLNFIAPSTLSGTPSMSGVSSITVTATDPGSMSATTSFTITVNPAAGTPPPPTGTFSITGVTTVSCATLSVGQRQVTFNPQYAGLNGSPVSFSVVNEMVPTTNPGPYTLNLYTDNPVITLKAVQAGSQASYIYDWQTACASANSRMGVAEPLAELRVRVLGNPTVSEEVLVEIEGASGALRLSVLDSRGRWVSQSSLESAVGVLRTRVRVGSPAGIYLLNVSTASQNQSIKVIKE